MHSCVLQITSCFITHSISNIRKEESSPAPTTSDVAPYRSGDPLLANYAEKFIWWRINMILFIPGRIIDIMNIWYDSAKSWLHAMQDNCYNEKLYDSVQPWLYDSVKPVCQGIKMSQNCYDSVEPVCGRICPFLAAFPDNGTIGAGLAVIQSDSLYCTAPHCTKLHPTAPYCTVLYCTTLHCTGHTSCTTLHHTWLYCTAKRKSTLYSTAQFRSSLHYTVIHYTAQHSVCIYCI